MLELKNISKKFDDRVILKDFNYTFEENKIYGIIGKSGVGKSTLLKTCGLLTTIDSGTVCYNNQVLPNKINKKTLNLYKKTYGFVFQEFLLLDDTVYNNIYETTNIAIDKNELKRVNLNVDINSNALNLSGGEKQRLQILRAIIKKPRILICYEITANLDVENAKNVVSLIKGLKNDNLIIIVATHDPKLVAICDEVINLDSLNNKYAHSIL